MNVQLSKTPIGLDGIPAAETVLSHVDGERGELIIAGEHVGDLARKTGFEGVTARLWSGGTGQPIGEAAVRAALGAARERAFARLPDLLGITRGLSIVDGFRAAIAGLRAEAGLAHEATIVGAFPVIAGALVQRAKGNDPIAPDPTASHAADTLSMILGRKPNAREVAALDVYFVTVCDHGMNASTFADGIRSPGLSRPRPPRRCAEGRDRAARRWHLPFAGEVEAYIRDALRRKNPDRPLDTNVEFFTAILLDALTIPRQAFTPIFAVARAAGWTAHAREQQRGGRLMRPSSAYTGAMPG